MTQHVSPKYRWQPDDDLLFEQSATNRHIVNYLYDERGIVVTLAQVKYQRERMLDQQRTNRMRAEKGLPLIERKPKGSFPEDKIHLIGTKPDTMLGEESQVPWSEIRAIRLANGILSYKETRKANYDPQMEEDMYESVKAIASKLPEDTLNHACEILHKVHMNWIQQCLERLQREKETEDAAQ